MMMKQSFEKFCEETDLQGLSYINKSQSRSAKVLWIFLVAAFFITLVSLIAYNFWLYSNRPMGINQTIESKAMQLPKMQLCFRWAVYSDSAIRRHNISLELAKVLQWRIEATYLVDVYNNISMYAHHNRSYKDIEPLLNRTKDEYDKLMRRLNMNNFADLVWELKLIRIQYPWMKFKTEMGEVKPEYYRNNHPFIFSYYEVEMGFATFLCELVNEAENHFAAEVPITYPPPEELFNNESARSSMTKIFLSLSRLVAVKDEASNVIARIRPGTNCFVTYSIRTFEAINSAERPCILKDDDCAEDCRRAAVLATFPGCAHCQSIFTHIKMGPWAEHGDLDPANLTNLTLCSPWEFSQCNFDSVQDKRAQFKRCQLSCRPLCNQTKYNYRAQADKLEDTDGGHRKATLSRIIIEPEKGPLKYIHIRQYEIMTIASILSDFGGYLGLFLGSSLLTVVHICVFCCKEFFHFMLRRCCPCYRKRLLGTHVSKFLGVAGTSIGANSIRSRHEGDAPFTHRNGGSGLPRAAQAETVPLSGYSPALSLRNPGYRPADSAAAYLSEAENGVLCPVDGHPL